MVMTAFKRSLSETFFTGQRATREACIVAALVFSQISRQPDRQRRGTELDGFWQQSIIVCRSGISGKNFSKRLIAISGYTTLACLYGIIHEYVPIHFIECQREISWTGGPNVDSP